MNYSKNKEILNSLMLKYGLSKDERKEFFKIIYKIFRHKEFQRRMTSEFNHHNDITLGYHVLEVALCTYKTCKKKIISFVYKKGSWCYNKDVISNSIC